MEIVASARAAATALTLEKAAHLLIDECTGELDRLLVYEPG